MTTDTKKQQNFPAVNTHGRAGDPGDKAIPSEMKAISDTLRGKPACP
jgi:hypothetical protein